MQLLVKDEVENGIILYRSDNELATNIRSYTIAKSGDKLIGFVALHIHSNTLAEVRSLVVDKDYQKQGVGKKMVNKLLVEAKSLAIKDVFTLTYQKAFFQKVGFLEIPKTDLPEQKIWSDCIRCKHFPICDEIALIKTI